MIQDPLYRPHVRDSRSTGMKGRQEGSRGRLMRCFELAAAKARNTNESY